MRVLRQVVWPTTKFAALAASAAATAYLTAVQVALVKGSTGLEVAGIAVLGFISISSSARSSFRQSLRSRWAKKDSELKVYLNALLLTSEGITKLNVRVFSSSLWVVAGAWLPQRLQHLQPVARAAFAGESASHVRWTRGKGVIGECWDIGRPVCKDLTVITDQYLTCDEAAWLTLDHDRRMGLTFKDWRATRGKYGSMLAVPVLDNADQLVGCLALNVKLDEVVAGHEQALSESLLSASRLVTHLVY